MVIISGFFFSSRKNIHNQYREFFNINDDDIPQSDEGDTETPVASPKDITARFYFALIYQLAKEDITKFGEIETMNLYICLNTAALIKERIEKEKAEIEKMRKQTQIK